MIIHSNIRDYKVVFTKLFDFVEELKFEHRFVVIDKIVYEKYGNVLEGLYDEENLFVLDSKEENKTLQTAMEIIDIMMKMESKRNTKLIAIGGGIVQDVSCFVATILYRGIDWYLIPTTLLAQTDSCIGSKSSINYNDSKNILGTFYPPTKIFIDVGFLDSIKRREYYSGLGEVLKCSIMQGKDAYYEMKSNIDGILAGDKVALTNEIKKTLTFKKSIIEIDEFDRDIRNIMNYGHTFGHAIESATEYAIPHGQAVSIGIAIANEVSVNRGYITAEYASDIFDVIKKMIDNIDIIPSSDSILHYMKNDKKYMGRMHTCILLSGDRVERMNDVKDEEVLNALTKTFSKIDLTLS